MRARLYLIAASCSWERKLQEALPILHTGSPARNASSPLTTPAARSVPKGPCSGRVSWGDPQARDGGRNAADCYVGQEIWNNLFLFPLSAVLQPPQLARRHSRLQSLGVLQWVFLAWLCKEAQLSSLHRVRVLVCMAV